jgi:uncharacterized protein (TIGR02996 family)
MRRALEAAIIANPDDRASHMAYADWLAEHNDPRGEFIQVQLALEDQSLPADRRASLEARELELLNEHGDAWLGDLADYLRDYDVQFTFARGWLDSLRIPRIREPLAAALADAAPQLRLLRTLVIAEPRDGEEPYDRQQSLNMHVLAGAVMYTEEEEPALDPLENCDFFGNVRYFQFGDPDHGPSDANDRLLPDLIAQMPKLEELILCPYSLEAERVFTLQTFPNLRRLHVCGVFSYPLELLAENPALKNLTHLALEPAQPDGHQKILDAEPLLNSKELPNLRHLQLRFHINGDRLAEEVVASGILKRLRTLDVQCCAMTDAGAEALAASPDLGNLETLDVRLNQLTDACRERLRGTVRTLDEPQADPDAEEGEGIGIEF